jgi:recombination protein RecT
MGTDLANRARNQVTGQQQQSESPKTIGALITSMKGEIARALPKHMDADRMARLALTMVRKTPKLAESTPESFAGSLLAAAAIGLEPGVNDECYLVPYRDNKKRIVECQLIIGYQGYAKLFFQSPLAKHLDAQAVYENDEFDYAYGLTPFLTHKPARGNRGQVIEYYAVATLTSGASAFVVLSAEEVKTLRRGKVGSSGDIPDPMHWMERKTAIRQLVKLLPKSANLAIAAKVDERSDIKPAEFSQIDTTPAAIESTPPQSDEPTDITGEWQETAEQPAAAETASAAASDNLTAAQLAKLEIHMKKDGLSTPESRHEWLTNQLHRSITSTSDLTKREASELIDYLATEQAKEAQS